MTQVPVCPLSHSSHLWFSAQAGGFQLFFAVGSQVHYNALTSLHIFTLVVQAMLTAALKLGKTPCDISKMLRTWEFCEELLQGHFLSTGEFLILAASQILMKYEDFCFTTLKMQLQNIKLLSYSTAESFQQPGALHLCCFVIGSFWLWCYPRGQNWHLWLLLLLL